MPKIAILGTRGIPNHHGGFEQFAEFFSVYMVNQGHEVFVYNSHSHPFQESSFKGVKIIHKSDPENKIGTAGQFIYDLNCILDARKRDFDIILQLGYTSSSIWGKLMPRKAIIVTNMDGLEWKRSKYNKIVQKFLMEAEKWAVNTSDFLISDSIGIQEYIKEKYGMMSQYIAYGAEPFTSPNIKSLEEYGLEQEKYSMLIARLEPENNIETILDGLVLGETEEPFIVIGKHETAYGEYLKDKYEGKEYIRFLGGIYNLEHLNNLRFFSKIYFHGHSVGGTNPSLLEAMASGSFIVAHDNIFNRSILGEDALYFGNSTEVASILSIDKKSKQIMMDNNFNKIKNQFTWDYINRQYEGYLMDCLN